AQLMIPFQVVMIPIYLLTVKMGIIDTLWALVIPMLIDAYGIFVAKQFVESLPGEILEAARIDGASEFGIYWRIVLPQLGPALASLGIFTFMASWNDYLWPLIVITSPEKRTIPLLLVWYSTQHGSNQGLVLAASILTLLPIFIVYFLAQRWIVQQASQSAFK
ncbi:MAG: carbohydrate ABC transporter permease, partial [Anaerolineales bacterium]|nr:carbohydrate ABC transporter permease [Anaerolineales bacterium]